MRHLTARIKANGPLSIAEYMKEVLTNPVTVRDQKQMHNEIQSKDCKLCIG